MIVFFIPDIFQEAGLPLWLRPYEVLVTSSYTALIETIPDTVIFFTFVYLVIHNVISDCIHCNSFISMQASLHSLKSRFPSIKSLRDFFIAKYEEDSPNFKLAQVNENWNEIYFSLAYGIRWFNICLYGYSFASGKGSTRFLSLTLIRGEGGFLFYCNEGKRLRPSL